VAWCLTTLRSSWRVQFIEFVSGGVQFREDALATGEGEGYWHASLVAFTVASSPATIGHAKRDSQRRGSTLEHVAHSGKWPMAVRSIPVDRRASGYGETHPRPSPSLSGARILTPP
jgi:hypothetical protein